MSGTHGAQNALFVLAPVAPAAAGRTDLAKGQVGLFQYGKLGAVSSLVNVKNAKYYLEVGTGVNSKVGGYTPKGMRTVVFSPKDVLDLTYEEAKAPTQPKIYLGYDGVDPTKTLKVPAGAAAAVHIKLTGEYISWLLAGQTSFHHEFTLTQDEIAACQDDCAETFCKNYTLKMIEKINERKLTYNVKLSDILEAHPVISCFDDEESTTGAWFWKITVADKGDSSALGIIQAQSPAGAVVARVDRQGLNSTYRIVVPTNATPAAITNYQPAILTNCEGACPAGYTKALGKYVYNISLDLNGTAIATIATALAAAINAVAGVSGATAVASGQDYNVGKFKVIIPVEMTPAIQAALLAYNPSYKLDTFEGVFNDLCVLNTQPTVAWVADGTCSVAKSQYKIYLEDTDCGTSRLAELQKAYPQLTISISETEVSDCRRAYLTEVISNVVCAECNPALFTFEAPAPFEFAEWKKVEKVGVIKTFEFDATGLTLPVAGTYTVTINGATFTIVVTGAEDEEVIASVTLVTGGLGFEVGEDYEIEEDGEEDNDDFVGLVITPLTLRNQETADCVCGIEFKVKDIGYCPEKEYSDRTFTLRSQMELEVSGGEILGDFLGYSYKIDNPFPQTRVSRAFNGTGWGFKFMDDERMSIERHTGIPVPNDNAERTLKGVSTSLEPCQQYDVISIKVKRVLEAGFDGQTSQTLRYRFPIVKGSKALYQNFFNAVAAQNLEVAAI